MNKLLAFCTLGLLELDVICIIIATTLDYWVLLDTPLVASFSGLWESCNEDKVNSRTRCYNIEENSAIYAVRTMLLMALFLVVSSIVCHVLKMFVLKDRHDIPFATAGFLGLAGFFLMIGFAVYVRKVFGKLNDASNGAFSLHAGFAFCVISWLLTSIAAGTTCAFAMDETE